MLLLGQVQVAEDLVAHSHWYPEEAAHRGMVRREPYRCRVLAKIRQPNHLRVLDQQPEQTSPFGQLTHLRSLRGVDTHVDKLGQTLLRAEHSQRPVAGVDQIDGGLHDASQGGVEFQSGTDRHDGIE
jgi:hypothetical protein